METGLNKYIRMRITLSRKHSPWAKLVDEPVAFLLRVEARIQMAKKVNIPQLVKALVAETGMPGALAQLLGVSWAATVEAFKTEPATGATLVQSLAHQRSTVFHLTHHNSMEVRAFLKKEIQERSLSESATAYWQTTLSEDEFKKRQLAELPSEYLEITLAKMLGELTAASDRTAPIPIQAHEHSSSSMKRPAENPPGEEPEAKQARRT
jgi:hypothetical protein